MSDAEFDQYQRLIGLYVSTSRPASPEEQRAYGSPTYGGAGVVVGIRRDGNDCYLQVDWGAEWKLTSDTAIAILS